MMNPADGVRLLLTLKTHIMLEKHAAWEAAGRDLSRFESGRGAGLAQAEGYLNHMIDELRAEIDEEFRYLEREHGTIDTEGEVIYMTPSHRR